MSHEYMLPQIDVPEFFFILKQIMASANDTGLTINLCISSVEGRDETALNSGQLIKQDILIKHYSSLPPFTVPFTPNSKKRLEKHRRGVSIDLNSMKTVQQTVSMNELITDLQSNLNSNSKIEIAGKKIRSCLDDPNESHAILDSIDKNTYPLEQQINGIDSSCSDYMDKTGCTISELYSKMAITDSLLDERVDESSNTCLQKENNLEMINDPDKTRDTPIKTTDDLSDNDNDDSPFAHKTIKSPPIKPTKELTFYQGNSGKTSVSFEVIPSVSISSNEVTVLRHSSTFPSVEAKRKQEVRFSTGSPSFQIFHQNSPPCKKRCLYSSIANVTNLIFGSSISKNEKRVLTPKQNISILKKSRVDVKESSIDPDCMVIDDLTRIIECNNMDNSLKKRVNDSSYFSNEELNENIKKS